MLRTLLLATLLATTCGLVACKSSKSASSAGDDGKDAPARLTTCPDAWYENRQPTTDGSTPTQYFVVDGKRYETTDYNLQYVQDNCPDLKPQPVY